MYISVALCSLQGQVPILKKRASHFTPPVSGAHAALQGSQLGNPQPSERPAVTAPKPSALAASSMGKGLHKTSTPLQHVSMLLGQGLSQPTATGMKRSFNQPFKTPRPDNKAHKHAVPLAAASTAPSSGVTNHAAATPADQEHEIAIMVTSTGHPKLSGPARRTGACTVSSKSACQGGPQAAVDTAAKTAATPAASNNRLLEKGEASLMNRGADAHDAAAVVRRGISTPSSSHAETDKPTQAVSGTITSVSTRQDTAASPCSALPFALQISPAQAALITAAASRGTRPMRDAMPASTTPTVRRTSGRTLPDLSMMKTVPSIQESKLQTTFGHDAAEATIIGDSAEEPLAAHSHPAPNSAASSLPAIEPPPPQPVQCPLLPSCDLSKEREPDEQSLSLCDTMWALANPPGGCLQNMWLHALH